MSRHASHCRVLTGCFFAMVWVLGAAEARGTAIVRIVPSTTSLDLGDTETLEIRADLSQPVLGFGLDLEFDPTRLAIVGTPVIGPPWLPLFAPDGDALAGLAIAGPIAGSDVLLATFVIEALAEGEATIVAALTPGDPTEGFPLDPLGFDRQVGFEAAILQVVPEPGSLLLLSLGLIGLRYFRHW